MPIHTESNKLDSSRGAQLFVATVNSCDPGTMVHELHPHGAQHSGRKAGIPLSHVFSSALGFKETLMHTVGSRVLCCGFGHGNMAIILGTIPSHDIQGDGGDSNSVGLFSKIALNSDEPLNHDTHKLPYQEQLTRLNTINNGLPSDVVQGEKVIANEFGVMLALFQLVATLRASDLAQIQCHFLDDLVRIVSHNFQHYTALGELSVMHDGRAINLEIGATHNPSESIGIPSVDAPTTKPITEASQTNTDANKSKNQFYQLSKNARALERLKVFVGKLGGFVNLLLCQPSSKGMFNADGTLNAAGEPDAGLLQVKANLDGSLIVRSVNGIYLEKTDWIRVPQRVLGADDPAGDDGTQAQYAKHDAFKFDDTYSYRNTAFLYYLQLRDYLAYTNEELGYADFGALKKDFYVGSDYNKNALSTKFDVANTFIDPYTGTTFKRTRAVFALMPNGGIAMADHWGSCIAMEGGNIYIQPAKDLVLQTNRDLIAKVPGNVSIAAQKEIDVSSTDGSMRVKTNGAQTYYSDQSGILLFANGQPSLPEINIFGTTKANLLSDNVAGVVAYAPNTGVTCYAPQIYNYAKKHIALHSADQLSICGEQVANVRSKELFLRSKDAYYETSGETIMYAANDFIALGGNQTILGQKSQVIALSTFGPVKGLFDRNDPNENEFFSFLQNEVNGIVQYQPDDFEKTLRLFYKPASLQNIQFKFPPASKYSLSAQDALPMTYNQQQAAITNSLGSTWKERAINDSYPYPGGTTNNPNKLFVGATSNRVHLVNNHLVNVVQSSTTNPEAKLNTPASPFEQSISI